MPNAHRRAMAFDYGTRQIGVAVGQTLTGSLMDYCLPRADDLPNFNIAFNEVIEADNPIGTKGAGESATTGAPAAVMNAIADALRGAGADPVDMPATPEKIWRALRAASTVRDRPAS